MYDLLQVMQQEGYLSSLELVALRKTCRELGENPVRVLRSLNIASPEQIQEYFKRYFRINMLEKKVLSVLDESYQFYLPEDLAISYSCFAYAEESLGLYVALEDPLDLTVKEELKFFLNKRILPVSATVFDLAEGLSKIYRVNVSKLKLSSLIERSRGVVGGLPYELSPVASLQMTDRSESKAPAGNLSVEDLKEVESFVVEQVPLPVASVEPVRTKKEEGQESFVSFGQDPALEPSAELTASDVMMTESHKEPDSAVHFIDGTEEQDFEKSEKINLNSQEILKISQAVNSVLIKISFAENKTQALELLNAALNSFFIFVTLKEEEIFEIQFKDLNFLFDFKGKEDENKTLVEETLAPALKNILKMKDAA
jgi:hypothetical protein